MKKVQMILLAAILFTGISSLTSASAMYAYSDSDYSYLPYTLDVDYRSDSRLIGDVCYMPMFYYNDQTGSGCGNDYLYIPTYPLTVVDTDTTAHYSRHSYTDCDAGVIYHGTHKCIGTDYVNAYYATPCYVANSSNCDNVVVYDEAYTNNYYLNYVCNLSNNCSNGFTYDIPTTNYNYTNNQVNSSNYSNYSGYGYSTYGYSQ